MTIFQFFLASLCCYRLTVLCSRDSLFKPVRALRYIGPFVGCHFCISVWLAAFIELAFVFSGVRDAPVVIGCIVFSMSAITIMLDKCFTADHVT